MENRQEQSPFFSLPAEIRDDIVARLIPDAVHAIIRQGPHGKVVTITPCLNPLTKGVLDGGERHPGPDDPGHPGDAFPGEGRKDRESTKVYMRRLRSSWGLHWECEEAATGMRYLNRKACRTAEKGHPTMAMLLVCKAMFRDVCEVLKGSVTYHFMDLDTLDYWSHMIPVSPTPSLAYQVLSPSNLVVKDLDITLRLPLSFFHSLAEDAEETTASHFPVGEGDLLHSWRRVWPSLAGRLQNTLRRLTVWLDHDDKQTWSLVDERTIVSHVTASISPHTCPSLTQLTFILPKLHAKHESPLRHFTEGSRNPPSSVKIERRFRQCRHYEETAEGEGNVVWRPDFPIMHEMLWSQCVEEKPDPPEPITLKDLENLEVFERDLVESGYDDPWRWLMGPGPCLYPNI
ncbi:hypothetical protein GE09DRAFT_4867 [Coniochaeta sp. 2T2.1]|nr:hypothetical protein GE09DRAFT_4867 [Coniochaeta sp. 2T2.1]